jgi:uncharacterized phiE125 gp8 family phage protein
MTIERITTTNERSQLPITLEELKSHLCITEDHQDELLRSYLEAATDWARETTRRAIAQRDYLITRDRFPDRMWELPLGHIQTINKIEYIDNDGVTQTWWDSAASPTPAQPFNADLATDHNPRLRPGLNETWPTTGDFMSAARVSVTAGWTQADIPYSIRSAILLKCGLLDEQRAAGDPEGDAIASAAESLLTNWMLPIWR